jgi:uncharacterized protein (DUF1330 family)
MAEYLVANFELTNPKGYKAYVPAVLPTLEAHNAEILVAEYDSEPLEGNPGSVTVVIKFESKQALDAWYNSPEYQKVIGLRTENSVGTAVSAGEFDLEKNLRILASM